MKLTVNRLYACPAWGHWRPDGRVSYIRGVELSLGATSETGAAHSLRAAFTLDQARDLHAQLAQILAQAASEAPVPTK
jgi:hypothetical protein